MGAEVHQRRDRAVTLSDEQVNTSELRMFLFYCPDLLFHYGSLVNRICDFVLRHYLSHSRRFLTRGKVIHYAEPSF